MPNPTPSPAIRPIDRRPWWPGVYIDDTGTLWSPYTLLHAEDRQTINVTTETLRKMLRSP